MTDQRGSDDAGRESNTSGDPTSPLDFDPYRFGKPDHPIPPEYAPPGYVPPTPQDPGPVWPPKDPPSGSQPPANYPPPNYPPPNYPPPQQPYGYPQPYAGYTPHPPPPPGYPPYGQVRPSNGRATTAMVLGILSVVFFWLTLLDLALAIPAIVLGALGIRDAKRFPQQVGRGKAMAGLICGIAAIVLIVVLFIFVISRVHSCFNYGFSSDRYQSCVNDHL